ncbi:MAG TPA: polyphosphate kinase 2 family protein [Candidatus Kapabacteria bacterium]|jgi:PPK2 family polyphosphate:nucleotide phosphotransferase
MLSDDFLIKPHADVSLEAIDPTKTPGLRSKKSAEAKLTRDIEELSTLQSELFAQDTYALLVIFQAMDTAGKDGAIKHVLTGVNPQGVEVHNFRVPTPEELNHDFMWRALRVLPERGRIGIFNRSYYEEVLTVRVHSDLLAQEKLPRMTHHTSLWHDRYDDINAIERYLTRNGTRIVKFHLCISKEEQRKRLLERIDDKEKNYKISTADITERDFWNDYMSAYDAMLRHTSTEDAPWYVIPADHKWYARIAVADILVRTLKSLDLEFPSVTKEKRKEIEKAKRLLMAEKKKDEN